MNYVVNAAEWDFNGLTPSQISDKMEVALAFIEDEGARGRAVAIGDDFQTRPMYGGKALWDLFSPDIGLQLGKELADELAAWLDRAPFYLDSAQWPVGFGGSPISIDGAAAVQNEDVEWAHFSVLAGEPVACLTINDPAVKETVSGTGKSNVHFVSNKKTRLKFWREAIDVVGDTLDNLIRLSPSAFPDLYFHDGSLRGASGLSGGYLGNRLALRKTLAALNDWGSWTFIHPPPAKTPLERSDPDLNARPTNQLIEHRFRGLQLDVVPEKPNVYKDKTSREAREISIHGRTFYCEWHVRLQPHRNRIHIHAPVAESGHRLVVAIVHEHLPLPK